MAEKTYYSAHIGSSFVFQSGTKAVFIGGTYTTKEASEQAELDKVADRGGTFISSSAAVAAQLVKTETTEVAEEVKKQAAEAAKIASNAGGQVNT